MRLPLSLVLALCAPLSLALDGIKRSYSTHDYYVIEHDPNGFASPSECARELGVELVGQAGELSNFWVVRSPKLSSRDVPRSSRDTVINKWNSLRTVQRSTAVPRSSEQSRRRRIASSIKHFSPQELRQRVKRDDSLLQRAPPPISGGNPPSLSEAYADRYGFTDPLFTSQWHIINDEHPEHMMNVTGVWDMGITGKGVLTALVDDGLDYKSLDLASNFDAANSYDYNDHVDLPTPMLSDDRHGTRCAGQIAAAKNDVCGVGIAYESKVAGVRILSGPITDIDEAAALNYGYQNSSIYSCSWGPPDDGRSMEAPGYLIQKAMVNGIINGRGGKGSIFVFASGNGAASGDQCNFDGYTNSIYSVTVSAVDYKGMHPYYSEACAANMVVAYSSGGGQFIVTTDVGENACATTHGGTSAAAPNAAGVFALALETRPDLTWRDIQHLCVQTAQMINLEDADWEPTAAGKKYSYKYGYGALNAYAFVTAAQDWELVKPQAWFEPPAIQIANGTMDENEKMSGGEAIPGNGLKSTMAITQEMLDEHNFELLEHITVRVWIEHTKRGDVEVEITSPGGVRSVLAAKRDKDFAKSGFPGWRFMSVKHWGENPVGDWTIRVKDQADPAHNGSFLGWQMMFWGSTIDASKGKQYVLPNNDYLLPSPPEDDAIDIPTPTSTKTHPKPTEGLPEDHGHAEGENKHPAFPGGPGQQQDDAESDPSAPSVSATPDEGWFSDMSNLVSNQKWFFGAIGAVALFGLGAGVFFWRRRAVQRRARYTSLADDEVAMSGISGRADRPRAKELYDAFGEVSDEDADEETGLKPQASSEGLGYHSGFLDDDDPASASGPGPSRYKDEPEDENSSGRSESPASGSGSGSGSGSWEHASQTR